MNKIKTIWQKLIALILVSYVGSAYGALGNLGNITGVSGSTLEPKTLIEDIATDYGPLIIGVIGVIALIGVAYRLYIKWDESQEKNNIQIFLTSLITSVIMLLVVGAFLWAANLLI